MTKWTGLLSAAFVFLAGLLGGPRVSFSAAVEVEPDLLAQIQAGGAAGYLIYLHEHPDLSAATKMSWDERGKFVQQKLEEAAGKSQAAVRAYLDAQHVSYRAFWIDNIIVVESSTAATFNGLLKFPEIQALRSQRTMHLIEPEKTAPAGPAPETVECNLTHVNADDAWTAGTTGAGIVVANIDTGVRATHNAVASRYRGVATGSSDYNWWDPYGTHASPADDNGHGTHTMGTMLGDDGAGNQIGIAPGAKWIACRGCSTSSCTGAALLECAQFVAAPWDLNHANPDASKRPHVVNNSWGDCGQSYDGWYQGVVDSWHAAGVYPVFSNGNSSNCGYSSPPGLNTVGNPARYGNVTGVGATGQCNGVYATFSNWGPTDNPDAVNPRGYPTLKPQVSAPGSSIRSSVNSSDTAYESWSGTSMAAPHVSGLVALLWEAGPCLVGDYAATETLMESTTVPIPYATGNGDEGPGNVPNHATGWGEIDALAAVQAAQGACGPDFTIQVTPTSLEVCKPNAAAFTVQIGQQQGFTEPVTLSTVGRPAGTTESYTTNPVTPPGSSVLTLGTSGAAAGAYGFDVKGTSASETHQKSASLLVVGAAPGAPTLVSPANGILGESTTPSFSWTAATGATSYDLEVSLDPAFGTLFYGAHVTGTTHAAASPLDALTYYYWRVKANNPCGTTVSATYHFMTANQYCSSPGLAIPDSDPTGASDTLSVPDSFLVADLDVLIESTHTWVGDLVFQVTHVDTGTAVTIIDRPGVPASTYGCSGGDIGAVMSDEAALPVENECASSSPAIAGTFIPNNLLGAFDGENAGGSWRMTVSDNAAGDTGTLDRWCLGTGNSALRGLGRADYDGDLQEEIGVFRNGMWFLTYSPDYAGIDLQRAFGSPVAGRDAPEIGEFNCLAAGGGAPDGKTDLAVLRKPFSTWMATLSPDWGSAPDLVKTFGTTSHKRLPMRALDVNGDGCSDIGVFRNGCFDVLASPTYETTTTQVCFGNGTDEPGAADLDGDGKSDLMLWRAATSHFSYRLSSEAYSSDHGADLGAGDVPVFGDMNSDGKADLGSYKPIYSTFRFTYSPDFVGVDLVKTHGVNGDVPLVADVSGDEVADLGVFRNATARWWFQCSPGWSTSCLSKSFGVAGDIPVYGKPAGLP